MPNSWERDPNLSLREREEKKNTIFLYFPWDAGAQRDENFTLLGVTQSENEDITFCRASERGMMTLYLYINGPQEAHAKNKLFFSWETDFFLKCMNLYLRWEFGWIPGTGNGVVCVCLLHMAGEGSLLLMGLPWLSLIFFLIKIASSSIGDFPLPWQSMVSEPLQKTSFVVNIYSMPTKQGKLAEGPNLLNGCPNRKSKNPW